MRARPALTALAPQTFEKTIEDLWAFNAEVEKEIHRLEGVVAEREHLHADAAAEHDDVLREAFEGLKELGGGVREVATKVCTALPRPAEADGNPPPLPAVLLQVVHVGDQLEGVNAKRTRCVDAARLMRHFSAFASEVALLLVSLLPPLT